MSYNETALLERRGPGGPVRTNVRVLGRERRIYADNENTGELVRIRLVTVLVEGETEPRDIEASRLVRQR